jgi:MinD superfamily P-loop ATPase
MVNLYSINGKPVLIEARMNIGVMSPVPIIKAAIKQINDQAEIAIFDSPPGTSCPFIQTVAHSDYVILVTEPTLFGLSDLKQSVETLKKIDKPCGVIINRAGLGNIDINDWLKKNNINLLMEIPFKKEIARMYSIGELVSETDIIFAKQLTNVVEKIIIQNGNSSH